MRSNHGQSGLVFLRVKSVGLHLIPHYVTLGCGSWLFLDITMLHAASEQRLRDPCTNVQFVSTHPSDEDESDLGTRDCHPSCKDLLDDCLLKEGCATALGALGELRNKDTDCERALVLKYFEVVNYQ